MNINSRILLHSLIYLNTYTLNFEGCHNYNPNRSCERLSFLLFPIFQIDEDGHDGKRMLPKTYNRPKVVQDMRKGACFDKIVEGMSNRGWGGHKQVEKGVSGEN